MLIQSLYLVTHLQSNGLHTEGVGEALQQGTSTQTHSHGGDQLKLIHMVAINSSRLVNMVKIEDETRI